MKRLRTIAIACLAATLVVVLAGLIAIYTVPLPERLHDGDSPVATYDDGRPAHILLADDDRWRLPTDLDHVDPAYIDALLALEDRRFHRHPGFDPLAILRATLDNLSQGRTVSGASTITMQLVRLLEPRPRTLRSKVVEALRAIQLERHLSKDEILAAYLRFTPYGSNLEGVEAAALAFWDRRPLALTPAEIATLLAIPQNPSALRPEADNRRRLRDARDRIAHRLADQDAIAMASRPDALNQHLDESPVPIATNSLPRDLPQLMPWLQQQAPDDARLHTTLQRDLQRRLAGIVADHRPGLMGRGAPHAAAVLVEHDTQKVRALIANLDYGPHHPGSFLPAFDNPRSTGSLLKPVAYGAALDDARLLPSHKLADVPITRGDYRPQNFDRQFRGLVEAEEALSLSLNLPFVRLLDDLGLDAFRQAMLQVGQLEPIRRSGHGGLEMIVGGMNATPLEIADLYATLAAGGQHQPLTLLHDHRAPESPALEPLSDESLWLTARALTRRPHPEAPRRSAQNLAPAFVWKTGTSFAYHDAWTAGFGERYALSVWAGDLAFKRHPQLVGAQVAAPLFFDILRAVDDPYDLRRHRPDDLTPLEVCPDSGRRPGPHCPTTSTTTAPAKSASPHTCDQHVSIRVHQPTGRRLPPGCHPPDITADHVTTRVAHRLPHAVAQFLRATGRPDRALPPIHPDCRGDTDAPLQIARPEAGTTVLLDPHRPADEQLLRLQAYAPDASTIHWYIDGHHLDTTEPDEPTHWTPEVGRASITAVDDRGHRHSVTIEVEER